MTDRIAEIGARFNRGEEYPVDIRTLLDEVKRLTGEIKEIEKFGYADLVDRCKKLEAVRVAAESVVDWYRPTKHDVPLYKLVEALAACEPEKSDD